MNETPRRRLLDRMAASPTLIAAHSTVRGELDADGPLMVNGRFHGNARVRGEVAIGTDARWEGNIEAVNAVVAGEVIGDIIASDKLEVGASARIRGRVSAKRVAIARGAMIEGEIICTGTEPVVRFEERRSVLA
jgi:cytoskeletal protein CcmA (bactofilin family)